MNADPTDIVADDETDKNLLYRIGSKAKSFQSTLERIVLLANRERKSAKKFDVPLRRRLWLWRHGFLTEAGVYFDLSEETVDDYLTNYQRDVKTKDINGKTGRVLDDKLAFHQLLSNDSAEYLPDLYAYIWENTFHSIDLDEQADVKETLLEKITDGNGVVCKPRVGGGGEGVYIIEATEDGCHINGRAASLPEVTELLSSLDEYLIYENVQQADYAEAIYPDSTNTIRVLTMIDPDSGDPFVGGVGHRFGADSSAPVDNWSSGGITSSIDESTETLGSAARWTSERGKHWLDTHPDTGVEITGTTVPEWSTIIDSLLAIAGKYPHLPYIGWDIVVTGDSGEFKIIEGNRYSDIHVLQIHKPLLDSKQNRKFFNHHHI